MKLNDCIVCSCCCDSLCLFFGDEGGCEIGSFNIWLSVKLVCKIDIRGDLTAEIVVILINTFYNKKPGTNSTRHYLM